MQGNGRAVTLRTKNVLRKQTQDQGGQKTELRMAVWSLPELCITHSSTESVSMSQNVMSNCLSYVIHTGCYQNDSESTRHKSHINPFLGRVNHLPHTQIELSYIAPQQSLCVNGCKALAIKGQIPHRHSPPIISAPPT